MKRFRTKYEPVRVRHTFTAVKSLTDQQYKDETSIQGIVRKYGILPEPKIEPRFGDVSNFGDFVMSMQRVQEGLSAFEGLPSDLRSRFGNDPKAFYEFLLNSENVDECVRLGLMKRIELKKETNEILQEISDKLSPVKENQAE